MHRKEYRSTRLSVKFFFDTVDGTHVVLCFAVNANSRDRARKFPINHGCAIDWFLGG